MKRGEASERARQSRRENNLQHEWGLTHQYDSILSSELIPGVHNMKKKRHSHLLFFVPDKGGGGVSNKVKRKKLGKKTCFISCLDS